jgi:SAM-dependent methyltransferase
MNEPPRRPGVPARQIALALRHGRAVPDAVFDAHIPWRFRTASPRFWTPVSVARTAAKLFEEAGVRRVLDVGSGVGKLCIVGALTSGVSFTGVEQRPHLVAAARSLAFRFSVDRRVEFVGGTLDAVRFECFDGFYFFNPFGENLYVDDEDQLDRTVELNGARFTRDVHLIEDTLGRLPLGTSFVTYHGFGGRIPDTYEPVRVERTSTSALRLWSKVREESEGGHWVEADDSMLFGTLGPRREYASEGDQAWAPG